ncbi:UvrD-helicase domain-containing protein [Candidatus Sumerlaeota bacterium]|nr:UvrD-helicase domain-containing protein [Candidatus Sumerlaeota bacterium]
MEPLNTATRQPHELPDAQAREWAESRLDQSFFVEAAAGAGKTTVLTRRVVRLICSGLAAVDQIAAITFTEKAAAELKDRVRMELERRARAGEAEDQRENCRKALEGLDAAAFSTIHGFCASILREFPVEAGLPPEFEISGEAVDEPLRAQNLWLEWLEKQPESAAGPLVDALRAGADWRRVRDVAELLGRRWELAERMASQELHLDDALREARRLADELAALIAEQCANRADTLCVIAEQYAAEVQRIIEGESAEEALARIAALKKPRGNLGAKAHWNGDEAKARVHELIGEIRPLTLAAGHVKIARLYEWAASYPRFCAELRRRTARLNFEDLLRLTRDLARDDLDARDQLRRRYRYLLVDEFQDTDPLQAEIVWLLASDDEGADWRAMQPRDGALFVVGDPKQSIYRFRNADIEIYEQARRFFPPERRLQLTTNFRSAPPVTDWINAAFSKLIHRPADGGNYQPDYAPLHPFRSDREHSRTLYLLPRRESLETLNAKSADACRALEAEIIGDWLRRTLDARSLLVLDRETNAQRLVEPGDVALLFRGMSNADLFEDVLRSFGVSCHVLSGRTFFNTPEVRLLTHLVRAVDQPHALWDFVAALRSPVFACEDERIFLCKERHGLLQPQLLKLDPDEADEESRSVIEAAHLLERWRNAAREQPPGAMIERIIDEAQLELIFTLRRNPERHLANLRKLREIARKLEAAGYSTLRGAADYLDQCRSVQQREEESPSDDETGGAVKLLTIHSAKGLEFPVVVLADLVSDVRGGTDAALFDASRGQVDLRLNDALMTMGYAEAKSHDIACAEAEETRLLYVAATRARDCLVVPWIFSPQAFGNLRGGRQKARLIEAAGLNPLSDSVTQNWEESLQVPGGGCVARINGAETRIWQQPEQPQTRAEDMRLLSELVNAEGALNAKTRQALDVRENWLIERERLALESLHCRAISTPSSLAHEDDFRRIVADASDEKITQPPSMLLRAAAMRFGAAAHRVLERIDLPVCREWEAVLSAAEDEFDLDAEERERLAQLIRRTLLSEAFQRIARAKETHREIPFCVRTERGLLEGQIDCLFREDDGWVVVDYKTDAIPSGGPAPLAERYRPQCRAYAQAIRQAAGETPKETALLLLQNDPPILLTVALGEDQS